MTRWPNSATPGVQPYNDAVRADLENVLAEVVSYADEFGTSAVELLENVMQLLDLDDRLGVEFDIAVRVLIDEVLEPHTSPELDVRDLTYELRELIGDDPSDDDYND